MSWRHASTETWRVPSAIWLINCVSKEKFLIDGKSLVDRWRHPERWLHFPERFNNFQSVVNAADVIHSPLSPTRWLICDSRILHHVVRHNRFHQKRLIVNYRTIPILTAIQSSSSTAVMGEWVVLKQRIHATLFCSPTRNAPFYSAQLIFKGSKNIRRESYARQQKSGPRSFFFREEKVLHLRDQR